MRSYIFLVFLLFTSSVSLINGQAIMNIFIPQAEMTCHSNQFKCKSGKCIPGIWRCDGADDCKDNSDENDCPTDCGHGTFMCQLSKKCIKQYQRCDGHSDCEFNEDEENCHRDACKKNQFRCHTTAVECIPKTQVCDYNPQCSDGSDELKRSCDSVGRVFKGKICEDGYFSCKSDGFCLDNYYVCDGSLECEDGSDERYCNKSKAITGTCDKAHFQCPGDGKCMSLSKRCDGVSDCKNNDDELGCTIQCNPKMYKCPSENKCLNSSQLCNGVPDCRDKSDEGNCTTPTPATKSCDPKLYFDCDGSGRQCIPWSSMCDKRNDCKINVGADERHENCSKNSCHTNNGGCSHNCTFDVKLKKQSCVCPKGYRIDPKNNLTCIDIDECKQWGTCSHLCVNRPGGYQCGCPEHYVTDINTKRCVVTGEKALMFTAQKDVREYKFSLNELKSVVHGLKNAVGFDVDQAKRPRILYWSTIIGEIHRTQLTSSGPQHKILFSDRNSVIDGLMLDWTNDLLYWTDTGRDLIGVMNLTSEQHTVLLEGKKWMDEPRAIVLDPEEGWLFWSDWSENDPKISMIGMNGLGYTVLVDKNIVKYPNALALDSVSRRLYYGDAKLKKIGCIDLNTRTHRNILVDDEIHPFAMTVFEDRVYWSDWRQDAVMSVDKFTGKDKKRLALTPKPMTLRILHPLVQQKLQGRCHQHDCSHMCLPSPTKELYTCACPVEMKLAADRKTCIGTGRPITRPNKAVIAAGDKQPSRVFVTPRNLPNVGVIAGITMGVILTVSVVAAITGVILYGKYSRRARRTRTMNFDNPGLIKTSEDLFALTRSNSSVRSMLLNVPSSQQPLWLYQTNNDIMDEACRDEIKV